MKQEITNEIIVDKKDVNNDIFWKHSKYQNPSFLAKNVIKAKQPKNEQLVNNIDDGLIDLIEKKFLKMKIPIIDIV